LLAGLTIPHVLFAPQVEDNIDDLGSLSAALQAREEGGDTSPKLRVLAGGRR
jgi:predicted metalloendopeptidase